MKIFAKASTGPVERLPINPLSPWWGEHRSRYHFAQQYVSGKHVLDIACGTGFGAHMLLEGATQHLVGIDLDEVGLKIAQRYCESCRASFIRGDGTCLPFSGGRFDVITSFETIEHIPDQDVFVRELRRVTKVDGYLILSTPNQTVTCRYPRNPFHVRELTPRELSELLLKHYRSVQLFGQHVAPSYRVVPFLPGKERPRTTADQVRLLWWKFMNRLPFSVRNRLARVLTGRPFYPGETDYVFDPDATDGHVILAVCRA